MKVYSSIIQAQLEVVAKAAQSAAKTGLIFLDSVSGVPYYAHADGTFRPFGTSGAASALIWQIADLSPTANPDSGLDFLDFASDSQQEIWTSFSVPADYVAGTQITLIGGKFATQSNVGKVLFKASSFLIKPDTESITDRSKSWKSLNAAVTISGPAGLLRTIGDVDLTSSTGKVKLANNTDVAVAANDLMLVKLAREVQSESPSAPAVASFLRFSMALKFSA